MNKRNINILLVALVVLEILDDSSVGILDIVKYVLIILCLVLNNLKKGG